MMNTLRLICSIAATGLCLVGCLSQRAAAQHPSFQVTRPVLEGVLIAHVDVAAFETSGIVPVRVRYEGDGEVCALTSSSRARLMTSVTDWEGEPVPFLGVSTYEVASDVYVRLRDGEETSFGVDLSYFGPLEQNHVYRIRIPFVGHECIMQDENVRSIRSSAEIWPDIAFTFEKKWLESVDQQ